MLKPLILSVGAALALSVAVSAKDMPIVKPETVGLSSAKLEELKQHFPGLCG